MYFIGSKVISIQNYFFNLDDENDETPFYQRSLCEPVDTSSTVNLLMKAKFPQRSVCKINPVKTSKNATFLVDKYFLESELDVFADDLGTGSSQKLKHLPLEKMTRHTSRQTKITRVLWTKPLELHVIFII